LGFSPFQAGLAFLPTTLPNFAAAIAVPKLTQRFGNGPLLAAGLGVSLIGMAWLSCASPVSDYFSAIALPMVLIGIGQGFSLSPLTVCGIANVEVNDAGAASGLVNVAHQFGGSLGLAVLVVVASATHVGALDARGALAHRIAATFSAGSLMLALALGIVWLFIVRTQSLQQTDRLSV
jgi:sugar phosphate permease